MMEKQLFKLLFLVILLGLCAQSCRNKDDTPLPITYASFGFSESLIESGRLVESGEYHVSGFFETYAEKASGSGACLTDLIVNERSLPLNPKKFSY